MVASIMEYLINTHMVPSVAGGAKMNMINDIMRAHGFGAECKLHPEWLKHLQAKVNVILPYLISLFLL